jgi:hypothetical protein
MRVQVATWWIPLAADAQNCNFLKKRVADSRRLLTRENPILRFE